MRNVISTVAHIDVTDEYSDAVDGILADIDRTDTPGVVLRETRQGRDAEMYRTRLVAYPQPGTGRTIYAVDDVDPDVHEVEESTRHTETDARAEAEARYEEIVRARAANLTVDTDGAPELLDVTDVEGVPARETV